MISIDGLAVDVYKRQLVDEINQEVNRQLEERIRIYEQKILPALRKHHIIFYQSRNVVPFHRDFLRSFFREEIFPSTIFMKKDMFTINKNGLPYGRGYVCSLQYHLVWSTKYRQNVFKDGIDVECIEMLESLAQ